MHSKIVITFNVQNIMDVGDCVLIESFEPKVDDSKFVLFEVRDIPLLFAGNSSSFSETRSHSGVAVAPPRFVPFINQRDENLFVCFFLYKQAILLINSSMITLRLYSGYYVSFTR